MRSETVHVDGRGVVRAVRFGAQTIAVDFEFLEGSALIEFEGDPVGVEPLVGPGSIEVFRHAMARTPTIGQPMRLRFAFSRERAT